MKYQVLTILGGFLIALSLSQAATLEVDKERSRIGVNAKATGHVFSGTLKDYKATVSGDNAGVSCGGKPDFQRKISNKRCGGCGWRF